MSQINPGWCVIYTRPQHEKKVQQDLAERNLKTFLPCVKTLRTWSDRQKYVSVPLFPSYLFVYLESSSDYFASLEIQSVLYFLKSGKQIARVKDEIVDNIRMLLGINDELEVSHRQFSVGQQLIIQEGAFAGQLCEVVKCDGFMKAIVRLDLMQRSVLVTLPKDFQCA